MTNVTNGMHWCDFCQLYHSSPSCYHPARGLSKERIEESRRDFAAGRYVTHEELKDEIRKLREELDAERGKEEADGSN